MGGHPCDLLEETVFFDQVEDAVVNRVDGPLLVSSFNLMSVGTYGIDGVHEGFFSDSEATGRRWLVTLDGVPAARLAAKRTGQSWPKLSGSDLIVPLFERASRKGWRVAVVGGTAESHRALVDIAATRWSSMVLCTWSPSRDELEDDSVSLAGEIEAFGADVVVLALPKPLSEQWAHEWASSAGAGVVMCFGAAVDFIVGAQTRAPRIFQRAGIEWTWRLITNPRRMTRRYLVEGPGEWWRLRHYRDEVATPALWRVRIARALLLVDVLAGLLGSLGASAMRALAGGEWLKHYSANPEAIALAVPIMVAAIGWAGGRRVRAVAGDSALWRRFFTGTLAGVAGVALASFFLHLYVYRGYVVLVGVCSLLLGALGRSMLDAWLTHSRRKGRNLVRVGVLGSASRLGELEAWFSSRPQHGYKVVRHWPDLTDADPRAVGVLCVDGDSSALVRLADDAMRGRGEVMVVPDLVALDAHRLCTVTFADRSVLNVVAHRDGVARRAAKRTLDLSVAAVGLVLAAPVLGVLAWRIKHEDGGPVLFRQVRVGRDGSAFTVLKLRSMVVDADAGKAALVEHNEVGPYQFKMSDDPRVTKVGRFLRASSLDELPQLWNVLRGDMSLVGPRPALAEEVALYPPGASRRHSVRPGLTGLWQVSGRSDLDSAQALALDVHYVDNWSVLEDISILVRTVRAVLAKEGAH
jgi:exopolysaccharide biosynthesis polyprenyl glycosylphosphotransferase